MAAQLGIVSFHQHDHTLTFRVQGRATMAQSLPLRRQAEAALEAGIRTIEVDLRQCVYMDSTFMGTMLALHKKATLLQSHFRLVAPSNPCTKILQQMGLLDILALSEHDLDESITWQELNCDTSDVVTFKRTVAQAHEELANLPGPAGEQFQAVLRCMTDADKKPSSGRE